MTTDKAPETLSELFARDPFNLTEQDIARLVQHYRDARRNFAITGKGVTSKQEVDLKDLGIL